MNAQAKRLALTFSYAIWFALNIAEHEVDANFVTVVAALSAFVLSCPVFRGGVTTATTVIRAFRIAWSTGGTT